MYSPFINHYHNITKTKQRQIIANKVTSKKAEKGYTLSEEKCTDCDMNLLLSSNGKSECKVCPAIKKWVQCKNDNNNTNNGNNDGNDNDNNNDNNNNDSDESDEEEDESKGYNNNNNYNKYIHGLGMCYIFFACFLI